MDNLKLGKLYRDFGIERAAVDKDKRTVALSFSSETPYERYFGMEILDHSEGAVNLKRLKRGGALLIDHDTTNQVGIIEDVSVGADRTGRSIVRFGRSAKAEEIFNDVLDGIRSNVSVGYMIDEMAFEGEKDGVKTYRAVKWTPYEVSLVACPADIAVGVGRGKEEIEREYTFKNQEDKKMDNIEVGKNRDEGAAIERTRVADILAIAKAHKADDIASSYITEGKSVESFKSEIMARMVTSKPIDTAVSVSAKEKREYSYARALLSTIDGSNCLEVEVSDSMRKNMPAGHKNRGGIIVPLQLRAGLDSTNSDSGLELAYTKYGGELIGLLRNQSICAGLGARIYSGLTSAISFPTKASEGAATWVAENPGSDVAESDDTTGTKSLSPKALTRTSSLSRLLLTVSVIDAEADIRDSISSAVSLAIDKAGIHGLGSSNEPTGIYAAASTNAKAMGGIPTFGKLIDMITAVASDNALLGTTGFATTPGMAGKLMQTLVASSAGSAMIWTGTQNGGYMCGYKAVASNQVSSLMTGSTPTGGSEHGIVFANWSDLLIGLFGGIEIITDPYRLKKQAMIEYTIFGLADVLVRRADSFCKATGATIV